MIGKAALNCLWFKHRRCRRETRPSTPGCAQYARCCSMPTYLGRGAFWRHRRCEFFVAYATA
jgi:hypothetical protein